MGQSQSQQKSFFWPVKGEILLWSLQQQKTFNDGESKLSESNNESIVATPTEYSLSWQSKSNQIQFVTTRISDGAKVRFNVDAMTGKLIKTEYIQLEKDEKSIFDELLPQAMWKCWVEIWQGQVKKNEIVLNKQESVENVQYESSILKIQNPTVKVYRERRGQIQLVTRQVYFTNSDENVKSSKYLVNMQFCKSQIWMFNWDLKQKVVPNQIFMELQCKLQSESLSFYQYTLN